MNNWKMRCVERPEALEHLYTEGKIYEVCNGEFMCDDGEIINGWSTFSDFAQSSFAKWELISDFKLNINGVDIQITDEQAKRMGFLKITQEEQDALHDELNKKLRKFSYENGGLDIDLSNPNTDKYHLTFNSYMNNIGCEIANIYIGLGEIYFKSGKIADRAIEEIVKPFMKENPQFVW